MTNIGTNYLSFLPLVSRVSPDARVLPTGEIDFTLDTGYQIDLTATVQSAQLVHPVQAIFVDAANQLYGNTAIQIFGTGQRIVVPAGVQGYYPILCTQNSFVFTFLNPSGFQQAAGTASLFVFFLNIPVVAAQWQSFQGGYGIGGLGQNPLGS